MHQTRHLAHVSSSAPSDVYTSQLPCRPFCASVSAAGPCLPGRIRPFAFCGDVSKAEGWTGLRPMTPDGTPVIGPTRYDNLFLNTGHGTLGWTMSCGSARAVADLIMDKKPEIDMDGLTAARFGQ